MKNNIKQITSRFYATIKNSEKLLSAISDLDKFNIHLDIPKIAVLGPQSSGKSSLIQAIAGDYILPVDMKTSTKKPTQITTLKNDVVKYKVADKIFTTAKDTADEIERLNNNSHVKKINVVVYSPHVHNSIFVDLPGLFSISGDGEKDDFRKTVKKMTLEYVSDPNYIPIVVHASPSDPANNAAMKIITKINRRDDTLGVLTKIDMVKDQKKDYIEQMLKGTNYKLGYGYCAVVLPNDSDIEKGITVNQKIKIEEEFFKSYPKIKPSGIPALRKIISDIQAEKILLHIPNIIEQIDTQIQSLKNSELSLTGLSLGNNESLSINLRCVIEKLVGSSYERSVFEQQLKNNLGEQIKKYLRLDDKKPKISLKKSRNRVVDPQFVKILSNKIKDKRIDQTDHFKQIFSFGAGSPIFIDNVNLNECYDNEILLAMTLPLIEPYIFDNLGCNRSNWNKKLNQYVNKLLEQETIHNMIKTITFDSLLKYINSDNSDESSFSKITEYMINEIGNEIFESKIKYSITSMINIEKRPNVSVFEIVRYVAHENPEILNVPFSLFTTPTMYKTQLEVFGECWTRAYTNVVIDNLSENCYRNVAVNLLDKMVEKLLEMTIDMCNKENAVRERNKVTKKILKLEEIRSIITNN